MTTENSMIGKICIVTGATSGIGYQTALELADRGAEVVLIGRNRERGAAALSNIQEKTGSEKLSMLLADLSSMAEVRRLAAEIKGKCEKINVLVNNAGGMFLQRRLSSDGLEMTFALNHLSYFLLTNLLLDCLKAAAPGRVVNVSSGSHLNAFIPFDDLQSEHGYRGMRAYGQSKLGNVLFTYELARRLEGAGVTANVLHPGFVATKIGKNNGVIARLATWLAQPIALRLDEGARTPVYLATSPEVADVTGKYFYMQREAPSSAASHDLESARRLWEISAELTDLND
jgi:NAD(P)-dependent dehydrogenase (short-subunit alcohol dehydrogenase family)